MIDISDDCMNLQVFLIKWMVMVDLIGVKTLQKSYSRQSYLRVGINQNNRIINIS